MGKPLHPKWRMAKGDGTDTSIADAKIRNDKGICGFTTCGKKLQSKDKKFFGMFICDDCSFTLEKHWESEIDKINKEFEKEYIEQYEIFSKER